MIPTRYQPAVHWATISLLIIALVLPALGDEAVIIGEGVDLFGSFWFYWWVDRSISEGLSLSHSDLFYYPYGKEIFAHTGSNLIDALISIPFQRIWGFPGYQPWFIAFILLLNAISFDFFLQSHIQSRIARWSGTALFTLCPFVGSELAMGRPTQAMLCFALLSMGCFHRLQQDRSWKWAILAGVFAALQGWTYWFSGYFLGFCLCWMVIAHRKMDRGICLRYSLSLGTCFLLILPAIVQMAMLSDAGSIPGLGADTGPFWSVPTQTENNVVKGLGGYLLSEPMGAPQFQLVTFGGLTVMALIWSRKPIWVGMLVIALLFSTGPIWPVRGGESEFIMYHYVAAYRVLPFFARLWFPYRMVAFALIAAILGISMLIDRIACSHPRKWHPIAAIALVLVTFGELSTHLLAPLNHQRLQIPGLYKELQRSPGALIELPIGFVRPSVMWQPLHGQPTFGGMGENLPMLQPKEQGLRLRQPLLRYLSRVTRKPSLVPKFDNEDKKRFVEQGFRYLSLDRSIVQGEANVRGNSGAALALEVQKSLTAHFGEPWGVENEIIIWALEKTDLPSSEYIADRDHPNLFRWKPKTPSRYEAYLRSSGRLPTQH
jgi:hypothetical protein